MQSLAEELGPHGIRVNAILPSAIEGERLRAVIAARAETAGVGAMTCLGGTWAQTRSAAGSRSTMWPHSPCSFARQQRAT